MIATFILIDDRRKKKGVLLRVYIYLKDFPYLFSLSEKSLKLWFFISNVFLGEAPAWKRGYDAQPRWMQFAAFVVYVSVQWRP